MSKTLTEYGLTRQTENFGKAGKTPPPISLVGRFPSPEIVAKVGIGKAEPNGRGTCRVVRRKARG